MEKLSFVYILTNTHNTVLYTGVTNNLARRIHEHKQRKIPGFTKRYNLNKLVYHECYTSISDAIYREKYIKKGTRKAKEKLINTQNPDWKDQSEEIFAL